MMLFFLIFLSCAAQAALFERETNLSPSYCTFDPDIPECLTINRPGYGQDPLPNDDIPVEYEYSHCCPGVEIAIVLADSNDPHLREYRYRTETIYPNLLKTIVSCEESATTISVPTSGVNFMGSSYAYTSGETMTVNLYVSVYEPDGSDTPLAPVMKKNLKITAPAPTSSDIPSEIPSTTLLEASRSITMIHTTVRTTEIAGGIPSTSTVLPKNTISDGDSEDKGLSAGAIAGIILGVIGGAVAFSSGILLFIRRHRKIKSTNTGPVNETHEDGGSPN